MKTIVTLLLMAVVGIQICNSQSFFEKVSNLKWKGEGELMGSKASFKMDWKPILDGKFYQLTFQNQREESKEYVFKARGIYRVGESNNVSGSWFDSRGYSFPLKGEVSEDALMVIWGSPELEQGKTIYTIKDGSTIFVEDYVLKDGEFIKFGNAEYKPNN
ncbi:hypothetical protein [Poritiphilus flavus]|uniref:Uncharacterized protein n=1 Tax=Poritiphilus flavus TaxID=2697053 RepID=A0A6L9E960_9FLAO|nr:hypothetical protein [Poritiphilus flavus]NAS11142.1 hypothetical protein [Poritiphilus flavus]